ncbi:hypothetical protein Q5H93_19045 [Hymenobacter sp. ASUV-10]|uniref:R3H domain-containing protein n=1 Tax=Hymenobacter aranciens TaxID=3063996 RepID=A0ABT9BGD4_9BACT|nr:hypothetical protein [Hymenobacter sp. ASUV-10]MDO7876850.1 hypothetical protein [Hymenobacter sp. ASUV-10]
MLEESTAPKHVIVEKDLEEYTEKAVQALREHGAEAELTRQSRRLFHVVADFRELGGTGYGSRQFQGQQMRLPQRPEWWPGKENLAQGVAQDTNSPLVTGESKHQ